MIMKRRRAYRRVHRAKGFPFCLPSQEDLEAVYLGKIAPSSAGVVYDESGNSNDAQLVNSYAMNFDGTVYASAGSNNFINADGSFKARYIFKTGADVTTSQIIEGLYYPKKAFSIGYTSSRLQFPISKDGVVHAIFYGVANRIQADTEYIIDIEVKDNNLNVKYVLQDLEDNIDVTAQYPIYNGGDSVLSLGHLYLGNTRLTNGTKLYYMNVNNKAIVNLCNGGLTETIPNTGTAGGDVTLYNATYPTLWTTQDVFHYNFLNGFDLYENGTAGEEIRVPIGHSFSQSGYTYTATYPAGTWNNNFEGGVKFPDALSSVQDVTPISSLTNNKYLEWVDGEIRGFTRELVGSSTITKESNGTRIYSPVGEQAYIYSTDLIESGKTYNYYIEITDVSIGGIYINLKGSNISFLTAGIFEGTSVASADGFILLSRSYGNADVTISKFYVWEAGTVPPLSYEEMESNYNGADIAFSNTEEGKKRRIVMYDSARTISEVITIQKCTDMKAGVDVLKEEDGVTPLTDENGIYLLEG